MICPRCASNQSDEIKFCTSCGANLEAVREALERREPAKKYDWGDRMAEMFMSSEVAELRKLEMERRLGITPEVKRYQEIKGGVIVSSVGIGLAIFLFIFMNGIVAGGVEPRAAEIISRLWIVGIIPFMVGLALIINGLVVSKKMVEIQERNQKPEALEEGVNPRGLRSADTSEFIPASVSVTEHTTRHLSNTGQKVDR